MNILVTGGNGYLGSKIIELFRNQHTMIALEKNCNDPFRLKNFPEVKMFDIEKEALKTIFSQYSIDVIIHTATLYGRNQEDDTLMFEANTASMRALLETAIKHKVKLFINTDTVLDRLTNAYALTKKQFNDWLQFYALQDKIQVINLELEHFYGPGTANTNFITLMVQKMLANEPVIPLTKAEQNRDFLYVSDLVKVYECMFQEYTTFARYESFEVGAGRNTNLKYILEFIHKETNSNSELNFGAIPYRHNELMESKTDTSKLQKLHWKPEVEIEVGIRNIINYEKSKS